MKILVIFTGGTIGSAVKNGYISARENEDSYLLLDLYNKKCKSKDIIFETLEPYTILSENLTGINIQVLGECLKNNIDKCYDGIIITHGTDTLQYSAAAFSFYLPELPIPVLLVSSNYVLDDPKANGLDNFTAAVEFIMKKAGKGIFVSYRNDDGIIYFHNGARLLPHLPYSDELYSVGNQYFALYKNHEIRLNPKYLSNTNKNANTSLTLPQTWDSHILRQSPYPGMRYPSLSDEIHAILLDTYHSGTLCSVTPSMESFFSEAYRLNIPVFLTGSANGLNYESVKEWQNMHICTLPTASPIAMYIKLWMAISKIEGKDFNQLKHLMYTNIADEFVIL